MRSVVVLVVLTLAACGGRTRVAVRAPAHTVDDRVEMSFECTRPRRVERCQGFTRMCPMVIEHVPAPCPPRSLTMRGDTGAVVHATIAPDGDVAAVLPGPGAPPREWKVEADGLPIGTARTRNYRHVTVLLDLAVIFTIAVGSTEFEGESMDGLKYYLGGFALYLLGTPLAHASHGHRGQALKSAAARLAGPVLSWLAHQIPCEESLTAAYTCAATQSRPFVLLSIAVAPVLMAWDTWRAVIHTGLPLVEPTMSADGDKTVFGVMGRF
jgi:hypothetical protein